MSGHGVKITVKKDGERDLLARLKGGTVRIGILADAPKEGGEGGSLLEVAAAHEFGLGVPRRSFLADWLTQNEAEILGIVRGLQERIVKDEISLEQAQEQFGLWAVASIQARIKSGIDPELAAETIARKGSSTPLIDTGQLWTSISYAIAASSAH